MKETKPPIDLALAPEAQVPDPDAAKKAGFWSKLKRGLFMTHTEIIDGWAPPSAGKVLDATTLEYLEEILI